MKKVIGFFVGGLALGIGLFISTFGFFYAAERYSLFDENFQEAKQLEVLENLITQLPDDAQDYCVSMAGKWVGSTTISNDTEIQSWVVTLHENGVFEAVFTTKSVVKESTSTQEGSWSCEKSILMTKYIENGIEYSTNYLVLYSDEEERKYTVIGPYGLYGIYTSYREKVVF